MADLILLDHGTKSIKDKEELFNRLSKGFNTRVLLKNHYTGKVLLETRNKLIVPGSGLIAHKIFDISGTNVEDEITPTYDSKITNIITSLVDISTEGTYYTYDYDNRTWVAKILPGEYDANTSYYATCSTAAATAAKTATIADQTFVLQTGARVFVKFTYANSAANSTLDVNSTGAKAIYYNGSAIAKSVTDANGTYEFVYNGTQWELVGDLDTNNTYTAATATPLMDGEGAVGTSTKYAREDHVHPSDTTKVDKVDGKGLSTNDYTTEEKTKLSNIASGAEVNQNAFSNVKVGSTTIAADSKTDTLTLTAGDNITLTPDASNDKVTIAATDTITTATTTGAGNAVTAITASNGQLSVVKGSEFILTSAIGTASGVCPLDANALIDSQYLPSFVDDIIEAYARTGATALSASWLSDTSASGSALTPQSGVIYVLMNDTTDYAANSQFRWSGTAYVKLNDGGVSPITNEEINTICV